MIKCASVIFLDAVHVAPLTLRVRTPGDKSPSGRNGGMFVGIEADRFTVSVCRV